MSEMSSFFQINWVILYFVYGQVFFVTGLVTALQSRRRSELELARSLHWLAAFGIIHGFNEWGYIFIPLQALYLPAPLVAASHILHLLVLASSYYCLLQFGIRLNRPAPSQWARSAPGLVFALWGGVLLLVAARGRFSFEELLNLGDIFSRYGMALPGSTLAAWGFLSQARQVRATMSRIARYLRGAAYTFAGYAIAGGLMVPVGPFPPASWLNYSTILAAIGTPVPVFRSICGLVMAYTITRSLEIFEAEVERRIEAIEQQRLLAEDRERIGRELHDGIIQSIFAAGLRLESALPLIEQQPWEAREIIHTTMTSLNEIIHNIRNYVFDLQRSNGHRELELVLSELVRELQLDTYLEVEYRVGGARCCRLHPERAEQLVQIAREALTNVVRHAQARRVSVYLEYGGDQIRLTVSDDGIGLSTRPLLGSEGNGQGLTNMRKRAEILHGKLHLKSAPGQGTTVEAIIPCHPDTESC